MSEPRRYVSKPVEIEAMEYDGTIDGGGHVLGWIGSGGGVARRDLGSDEAGAPWVIVIDTLEGAMTASAGDYVIRGTEGEFYPCKPSVFIRKYDEVQP